MDRVISPSEAEEALKNTGDKQFIGRAINRSIVGKPENEIFANCENDSRARGAESNMDIITSDN